MAQLPNTIDCTQEVDKQTREPLPPGPYSAQVINDEMKPTKKGDGKYIELTMEVLDGSHKGRWLFDRLNVVNPNKTAVEISERRLVEIGKACRIESLNDTNQLRGIPMKVTVKIEKSEEYGDRNVVTGYKKSDFTETNSEAEGTPPWQDGEKLPF